MSVISPVSSATQQKAPLVASQTTPLTPTATVVRETIGMQRHVPCISQKTKNEINQLQPSTKSSLSRKTKSVEAFFRALGVEQMPGNPFTPQDLEQIYRM